MDTIKKLLLSGVVGIVLAAAVVSPALAWHPKGKITKYVQNVSASGQMADADDAATAVSAKPGDTLKYTIVVENIGAVATNGYNDMYYVILNDTLPAGIALASDPQKRTITENLGVLKPGEKATKEYLVTVTSEKDGDVISNTACFTGDSKVKDNPQNGCNPAVVKIGLPPMPPKTPEPPKEPPKVVPPAELPHTGPGNFLPLAGLTASLGYVGNLLRLKRRDSRQA